ncbi:MAG: type I secretion system permease/ATPase [Gammaproteobacteria bacterium]|nr:type I secretion system permease/ATPase [Gammaproteobacteria bacterium]
MTKNKNTKQHQELNDAFWSIKRYFIYAGVFSAAVNILMLAPVIYMLQVYDRVIGSGSMSTLAMLTILLVCLLVAMGGFEWVRSRILISASNRIEKDLNKRVFDATFKRALLTGGKANAQANGDLSSLRQFLTGNGLFAFFDAPWFPIYVGVMFMFHPWFGVAAIFAGIVMVILAFVNQMVTSKKLQDANSQAYWVGNQISRSLQNAEVIAAMGMTANIRKAQEHSSDQVLKLQTSASKQAAVLTSVSKTFRMIMQSMLLGLGALLALQQEISPGMMIAGSLLLGRALAPIDMLVGNWKGFIVARSQYQRLGELLEQVPADDATMDLPTPKGNLSVDKVSVIPPGSNVPVIRNVSLNLSAGESLAIVGPSASGKSSLARALLGIWPAVSGKVRLDSADISSWDRAKLGPHIGYLPQDIELFDGSISENIGRFGDIDSKKIVAAAKLAGVHELILHLPEGYDTKIGASGGVLSGGQRQRIGLARAVYDNPCLIILDEPNSNLDEQGERQLAATIHQVKSRGCTVVVITHRTLLLGIVDKILVLQAGTTALYGPREDVLAKLKEQPRPAPAAAPGPAIVKQNENT